MKPTSSKIFVAAVSAIGAIFVTCGFSHPSATSSWRYKMTVIVETPEGEKTGFAVRQVNNTRDFLTKDIHSQIHGEAVVVDLGKRGVLFGAMQSQNLGADYPHLVDFYAFPPPKGKTIEAYLGSLKGAKKILAPGLYPQFVFFKNTLDPKTAENVLDVECDKFHPLNCVIKKDHSQEIFRSGVSIKRVEIEMTDAPVTRTIDPFLPWLPKYYNRKFGGKRFETTSKFPVAAGLSSGAFKVD